MNQKELEKLIADMQKKMQKAAAELELRGCGRAAVTR